MPRRAAPEFYYSAAVMWSDDFQKHRLDILMFVAGILIVAAIAQATSGRTGMRGGEQRGRQQNPTKTRARVQKIDYSEFSHQSHVVEQTLACNSCHKFPSKNWKEARKGAAAFPDITEYPEHKDCIGCHRQQFFARERPVPRICLNCHIKATPNDTSRYPFPSLGEKFLSSAKAVGFVSDFDVLFPHDKHLDAISEDPAADSDPKSCAVCHVTYQPQGESDDEFVTKPPKDLGDSFWLKKGTFKTRPATHEACFTCHNQESELAPLPQNCDACHRFSSSPPSGPDFDPALAKKIGIRDWWTLTAWRTRYSSGAVRHEVHSDMSCTKCHNINTLNTVDFKSLKVPINSCGGAEGCHVTATADDGGILNYEIDQRKMNEKFVCVKCHIVFGSKPSPASHFEAIVKAASK